MGIHLVCRSPSNLRALTSLVFALTRFLGATRFLRLTRLLLQPHPRRLFLTRFLEPFLLRLLALPAPRLFLRALLLHAFCRGAPERFSGVVAALLAQVP